MNDFLQNLRNGQAEKARAPKTRKSYDNSYHYNSGTPRFHSYSGYQNTRNQQMKRSSMPPQHPQGNQQPIVPEDSSINTMLADAIENLSLHIETLTKNQEFLIAVQEKTADMIERQAVAIERIVEHLNRTDTDVSQTVPKTAPAPAPRKTFQHRYISTAKPKASAPETIEPVQPQTKSVLRKRKRIVSKAKPAQSAAPVADSTQLLSREEVMDIIHSMRAEGATFDQVASHLVSLGQPTFSGRGEWHAQTIHRLCSKR